MKKKIAFKGLVQEFKLNSNKKVVKANYDMVHPENCSKNRAFSLTDADHVKIEKLRAKYKISRSAIIRILLNNVDV